MGILKKGQKDINYYIKKYQNMKENFYIIKNIMEKDMIKMVI